MKLTRELKNTGRMTNNYSNNVNKQTLSKMSIKLSSPKVDTVLSEIDVVKIGGKQMTISVYNQLYQEQCWDKDYNILYDILGKINRNGEFVIFQKGNVLRKCKIPKKEKPLTAKEAFIKLIKDNESVMKYGVEMSPDKQIMKKILNLQLFEITNKHIEILMNGIKKSPRIKTDILGSLFEKKHDEHLFKVEKQNKMVDELQNTKQLFIAL